VAYLSDISHCSYTPFFSEPTPPSSLLQLQHPYPASSLILPHLPSSSLILPYPPLSSLIFPHRPPHPPPHSLPSSSSPPTPTPPTAPTTPTPLLLVRLAFDPPPHARKAGIGVIDAETDESEEGEEDEDDDCDCDVCVDHCCFCRRLKQVSKKVGLRRRACSDVLRASMSMLDRAGRSTGCWDGKWWVVRALRLDLGCWGVRMPMDISGYRRCLWP